MSTRRSVLLGTIGAGAIASIVSSCLPVTSTPPIASNEPPVQVDLQKWSSGMYADLYANKAVIVDGYYLPPGPLSGLYQGSPTIIFSVANSNPYQTYNPPTTQAEMAAYAQKMAAQAQQPMGYAAVSAPISMRDQIFSLKPGQGIRVRGYAFKEGYRSAVAPQVLSGVALVINAQAIEPN